MNQCDKRQQVTYELRTCDIRVHTIDIQMACKLHANDIRNYGPYKGFGTFGS